MADDDRILAGPVPEQDVIVRQARVSLRPHGSEDGWLPINSSGRRIASPAPKRAGHEVRYCEFNGGHLVPTAIAREAAGWFVDRG
jgi:hypothetical protein